MRSLIVTRRTFLGTTAGVVGAVVAPMTHEEHIGEPLRVGVIGAGPQGVRHLDTAIAARGMRVAAVSDLRASRLRRAQQRCGHGRYRRPLAMDHADDLIGLVDVVMIATGVSSHMPLVEAALAANKHVYVERPALRSLLDAERLRAAATTTTGTVWIGVHGEDPYAAVDILDAVRRGTIGEPRHVEIAMPSWRDTIVELRDGAGDGGGEGHDGASTLSATWMLVDALDVARAALGVALPTTVWCAGALSASWRARRSREPHRSSPRIELVFDTAVGRKTIGIRQGAGERRYRLRLTGTRGTLDSGVPRYATELPPASENAAASQVPPSHPRGLPHLARFLDTIRAQTGRVQAGRQRTAHASALHDALLSSAVAQLVVSAIQFRTSVDLDAGGHTEDARIERVLWG